MSTFSIKCFKSKGQSISGGKIFLLTTEYAQVVRFSVLRIECTSASEI